MKEWVSLAEARRILDCSDRWISKLTSTGKLARRLDAATKQWTFLRRHLERERVIAIHRLQEHLDRILRGSR